MASRGDDISAEEIVTVERLRELVNVKDRRYRLGTYKKCFVGKDAVTAMVNAGFATDRDDAVALGQVLLEAGEINHVTRDHPFKDEELFYRFTKDEDHGGQLHEGSSKGTWAKFLEGSQSHVELQTVLPEFPPYEKQMDHPVEAKEVGVTPLTENNIRLLDNVRPTGWINPVPKSNYSLVAIGAGAGGLVSSSICASLGGTTALIEKHLLGGDCLNVGCVPSKALISAAHAVHTVKTASNFGVNIKGNIEVDFPAIMERMRKLRADISPNDSASRYTNEVGVDVFQGEAKFVSKNEVEVDGKILKFSKCVLAMGGRPKVPPIPGVIGAGPIGLEMAQSFARFGSHVTVFMRSNDILAKEDTDAARIVENALKEDGVIFEKNIVYDRIEKDNEGIKVHYTVKGEEGEHFVVVDELLVSAGRAPNVAGIGLEKAGVKFNEKTGVQVNDFLQTTNPNIYAVGDCCTRFQFTHVADFMARMAIRNAFFFGSGKFSQLLIPWATFTAPEIAHVGLYEADAKAKGIKYKVYTRHFDDVDRAILDGEQSTKGFVKIMCKGNTDEIIGATIVGDHAGDMISEISVAMQNNVKLGQIANVIHPYPTQGEAIRQVGDLYNKTRLTPTVKKLLRGLIKLR